MSANEETRENFVSDEAADVRRRFAALPFHQRLSTLFRVELDLVADAIEKAAAETTRVIDEVAKTFTSSTSTHQEPPPGPTTV